MGSGHVYSSYPELDLAEGTLEPPQPIVTQAIINPATAHLWFIMEPNYHTLS
jgi:hypothetical protein